MFTRILNAILMLCLLVSPQSRAREHYKSSLQSMEFFCRHTGNASVSFRNNVNLLLSDFNRRSAVLSYYNTTVGEGPDKVYGFYMCRGDVSLDVCNSCILNGTQFVVETDCCDEYMDGNFNSELCIFGYSNHSTYGLWKVSLIQYNFMRVNVSNFEQFNRTLSSTMEDLINEAAYNNNGSILGFATMEANVSQDETIYSLAQCTPDIVGPICNRCLRHGLSSLRYLANKAPAAHIRLIKCYLRYDNVSFYNLGNTNVSTSVRLRSSYVVAI